MPCCHACGCARSASDVEAPNKEAPPPGVQADRPDHTTSQSPVMKELVEKGGARIAKFICRAVLLLLWLYLYNSMRTYVNNRIDGDTWFCKFVVILVAVPMADAFIILAGLFLDY